MSQARRVGFEATLLESGGDCEIEKLPNIAGESTAKLWVLMAVDLVVWSLSVLECGETESRGLRFVD